MHDRTGIITPDTAIATLTPVSKITSTKSFSDICHKRAAELASMVKDNDQKISVFWSGGLDSTGVFLCLREQLPANKLVVYYTEKSKEEYPGFFEKYIEGSFEAKQFAMLTIWKAVEAAVKDGIIVTGEIGDQMFGSNIMLQYTPEQLKAPWQTCDKFETVDNFTAFVENCPRHINTVAEMLWWVNYSLKYQWVQLRMLQDNEVTRLNENIFHFFDTPEFNDYTVSASIEEKIPNFEVKNYKYPLREVIYSLSKDAHYAFNKPKEDSWAPNYGKFARSRVATAIDTNWVRSYASN